MFMSSYVSELNTLFFSKFSPQMLQECCRKEEKKEYIWS